MFPHAPLGANVPLKKRRHVLLYHMCSFVSKLGACISRMENYMTEQFPTVLEVLIEALEASNGETVDVVIEGELPGITEDMYRWWGQHRPGRTVRI